MSELLQNYYEKAISRTKEKILEDIDRYLEEKDSMPSYEQYLRERVEYISQIWLNFWINITVSEASREEKKRYLHEKGFEVEGLNKKLMNQMFRNEIREVKIYPFENWLNKLFATSSSNWEHRYEEVRALYREKIAREKQREIFKKLHRKFEYYIEQVIGEYYEDLYLYVRYLIGSHLTIEIERNGVVIENPENLTLEEYLYNEMDHPYNQFYFVEDKVQVYEALIISYLEDFGPNWLKEKLPISLDEEYVAIFHEPLNNHFIKEISSELFVDVSKEIIEDLLHERLSDLMKLFSIPFDIDRHRKIYEEDIRYREQIEQAEREERKQRKEHEARMMEDIFGREYYPPSSRNIHYVLHVGETNTGKTYQAIERMKKAESGLYLAPLRLLALEIYEKLNEEKVPCSLITGEEEKLVNGAKHLSCTVEMFNEKNNHEVVVIDESQMIADKDRGFAWYKAITKANAKEVHIICSFHAKTMIQQLLEGAKVDVHEYERENPLQVETSLFRLNQTRKGDALVCFSRRGVLETAADLQKTGRKVSLIYGSMPPETRKKQMQLFLNGDTSVIVSTDAIGMGLNLPIRRIVFLENDKFDGTKRRLLTSQEVKQIAGRAGRKGLYDVGKVAFTHEPKKMKYLLEKKDEELTGFAIAPTSTVLERFQKYSNNLGLFFYLWDHFKSPEGTKKASLSEEKVLYEMIQDTEIEARLSIYDLFSFLRIPFATNEPVLREQWKRKLSSIVDNQELPDPIIKEGSLEEMELSYKSVGLHLLFLYKLGKRTEAYYWERIREEISDHIHENLKSGVKSRRKQCKSCGKELPNKFKYPICNECFYENRRGM